MIIGNRFFAAGLLVLVLSGALAAQQPRYETTRIAEGVYQFRWQSHNGFFVVGDDGVIAFDPISNEAAAQYAAEIRRIAPGKPLRAIVYSHHHADHATGARVLREQLGAGAPVIAHARARDPLTAQPNPDLPAPDITFSDRLTLYVGGRPIELRYLGRSHSDNMIVGYLPNEKIAFAVDFVSNDRVGYRDLPDYYFPDFFEALKRLQEIDYTTVVFGHGPPGDRAAVDRQIRYYDALRAAVEQAVARGLTEDQAADSVKLAEFAAWGGYQEWLPLNVRAVHRWLARRN